MVAESEGGSVFVYGDDLSVHADNVYIEYAEETEYTNNQLLQQINQNIVDGFSLLTGLIGLLVGFMAIKELLKIWLH